MSKDSRVPPGLTELVVSHGFSPSSVSQAASTLTSVDIFEGVHVSCADLQSFTRLEEVSIIHAPNVRSLRGLCGESLTRVFIIECNLTEISGLEACPNIRVLNLDGNSIQRIENVSHLKRLESLWLNDNEISQIDGLSGCSSLRELHLARNRIRLLQQSPDSLGRGGEPSTTGPAAGSGEKLLPGKQKEGDAMMMGHGRATITAGEERSGLQGLLALESLNLAANEIGSFDDLAVVAELPSLRTLTLSDDHWGSNPLCSLFNYFTYALFQLPRLEWLDGRQISPASRSTAEATFIKKRVYYNMRCKALRKNMHVAASAGKVIVDSLSILSDVSWAPLAHAASALEAHLSLHKSLYPTTTGSMEANITSATSSASAVSSSSSVTRALGVGGGGKRRGGVGATKRGSPSTSPNQANNTSNSSTSANAAGKNNENNVGQGTSPEKVVPSAASLASSTATTSPSQFSASVGGAVSGMPLTITSPPPRVMSNEEAIAAQEKLSALKVALQQRQDAMRALIERAGALERSIDLISSSHRRRMDVELCSGGNVRMEEGKFSTAYAASVSVSPPSVFTSQKDAGGMSGGRAPGRSSASGLYSSATALNAAVTPGITAKSTNSADPWVNSVADLLRARFFPKDYLQVGVGSARVVRVLKLHNRHLRSQFDKRIANIFSLQPQLQSSIAAAVASAAASEATASAQLVPETPTDSSAATGKVNDGSYSSSPSSASGRKVVSPFSTVHTNKKGVEYVFYVPTWSSSSLPAATALVSSGEQLDTRSNTALSLQQGMSAALPTVADDLLATPIAGLSSVTKREGGGGADGIFDHSYIPSTSSSSSPHPHSLQEDFRVDLSGGAKFVASKAALYINLQSEIDKIACRGFDASNATILVNASPLSANHYMPAAVTYAPLVGGGDPETASSVSSSAFDTTAGRRGGGSGGSSGATSSTAPVETILPYDGKRHCAWAIPVSASLSSIDMPRLAAELAALSSAETSGVHSPEHPRRDVPPSASASADVPHSVTMNGPHLAFSSMQDKIPGNSSQNSSITPNQSSRLSASAWLNNAFASKPLNSSTLAARSFNSSSAPGLGAASSPVPPSGAEKRVRQAIVVVCKCFVGNSLDLTDGSSTLSPSAASEAAVLSPKKGAGGTPSRNQPPPAVHIVHKQRSDDFKQRVLGILDPALLLPEYIVEFEYALESPLVDASSAKSSLPSNTTLQLLQGGGYKAPSTASSSSSVSTTVPRVLSPHFEAFSLPPVESLTQQFSSLLPLALRGRLAGSSLLAMCTQTAWQLLCGSLGVFQLFPREQQSPTTLACILALSDASLALTPSLPPSLSAHEESDLRPLLLSMTSFLAAVANVLQFFSPKTLLTAGQRDQLVSILQASCQRRKVESARFPPPSYVALLDAGALNMLLMEPLTTPRSSPEGDNHSLPNGILSFSLIAARGSFGDRVLSSQSPPLCISWRDAVHLSQQLLQGQAKVVGKAAVAAAAATAAAAVSAAASTPPGSSAGSTMLPLQGGVPTVRLCDVDGRQGPMTQMLGAVPPFVLNDGALRMSSGVAGALQELNLRDCSLTGRIDIGTLVVGSRSVSALRVLDLSFNGITQVCKLQALVHLEELNLSHNQLSDSAFFASDGDARNTSGGREEAALSCLPFPPALLKIDLSYNRINQCITVLRLLRALNGKASINLSKNAVIALLESYSSTKGSISSDAFTLVALCGDETGSHHAYSKMLTELPAAAAVAAPLSLADASASTMSAILAVIFHHMPQLLVEAGPKLEASPSHDGAASSFPSSSFLAQRSLCIHADTSDAKAAAAFDALLRVIPVEAERLLSLSARSACSHLRYLDLTRSGLSKEWLAHPSVFLAFASMRDLTHLIMDQNQLDSLVLGATAPSSVFLSLKGGKDSEATSSILKRSEMTPQPSPPPPNEFILNALTVLPKLHELSLAKCALVSLGSSRIRGVLAATSSGSGAPLAGSDRGKLQLPASAAGRPLSLSSSPRSLAWAAPLSQLVHLRRLDLSANFLDDAALVTARLDLLRSLTQLCLDFNQLQTFTGIEGCSSLMELYVRHNCLGEGTPTTTAFQASNSSSSSLALLSPAAAGRKGEGRAAEETKQQRSSHEHLVHYFNQPHRILRLLSPERFPSLIMADFTCNPFSQCQADYREYAIFHMRRLRVLDGIIIPSEESAAVRDQYCGRLNLEFLEERMRLAASARDMTAGTSSLASATAAATSSASSVLSPDAIKIEDVISCLASMRELDCASCKFSIVDDLPGELFPALVKINLDHNALTPASLSGLRTLPKLVSLSLSHNKVTTFNDLAAAITAPTASAAVAVSTADPSSSSSSFGTLPTFSLSWQPPSTFLQQLQMLCLSHNGIHDMDTVGFAHLPRLRVLDLSFNEISRISSLQHCPLLQDLNVEGNSIRSIDGHAFSACSKSLRVLRLANNGLRSLAHFEVCTSLRILLAPFNRIGELEDVDTLSSLAAVLHELFLSNNPITRKVAYRYSILQRLRALKVLDGKEVTEEERSKILDPSAAAAAASAANSVYPTTIHLSGFLGSGGSTPAAAASAPPPFDVGAAGGHIFPATLQSAERVLTTTTSSSSFMLPWSTNVLSSNAPAIFGGALHSPFPLAFPSTAPLTAAAAPAQGSGRPSVSVTTIAASLSTATGNTASGHERRTLASLRSVSGSTLAASTQSSAAAGYNSTSSAAPVILLVGGGAFPSNSSTPSGGGGNKGTLSVSGMQVSTTTSNAASLSSPRKR